MNKRSGIQSKKKVLNAAMKVFSIYGYTEASIREIAKTAGISVGGVYLYFKNKEELYLNLIKDRIDDLVHKTEVIAESSESPTMALSDFLSIHLDYARKHKQLILIHLMEHGFSSAMETKRQFFENQVKLLQRIIIKGIRAGEFKKCNTNEVAKIIMGTLRGIVLSIAVDDVIVTQEKVNELILNGILRCSKTC